MLNVQMFGDEPVLRSNIVKDGDVGKARTVKGLGGVAGRGGQSVAEHVRDDDEVLRRVQAHPLADQPLVLPVAS